MTDVMLKWNLSLKAVSLNVFYLSKTYKLLNDCMRNIHSLTTTPSSLCLSLSPSLCFCQLGQRLERDWSSALLRHLLFGSLKAMCYGCWLTAKREGKGVWVLQCLCFETEKEREVWALDVDLFVWVSVVETDKYMAICKRFSYKNRSH